MTKLDIFNALESLKDYVNQAGKETLDGIKAAVMLLEERGPAVSESLPEQRPPDIPEPLLPEEAAGSEDLWKPLNEPAKKGVKTKVKAKKVGKSKK